MGCCGKMNIYFKVETPNFVRVFNYPCLGKNFMVAMDNFSHGGRSSPSLFQNTPNVTVSSHSERLPALICLNLTDKSAEPGILEKSWLQIQTFCGEKSPV